MTTGGAVTRGRRGGSRWEAVPSRRVSMSAQCVLAVAMLSGMVLWCGTHASSRFLSSLSRSLSLQTLMYSMDFSIALPSASPLVK